MYAATLADPDDGDPRNQVERRRKPFVPDPYRLVYPVDYQTGQQYAVEEFKAKSRIEVGGQLTRRIIRHVGELEEFIREQAQDAAHYTLMEQVLVSYVGDAIQARHDYMNPDERPRYQR